MAEIILISLVGMFYIAIKAIKKANKEAEEKLNKEAEEERRLRSKIIATTRSDFIKGYDIENTISWVQSESCDSTREFEEDIKLKAARIGANAVIKVHWEQIKVRDVAGYGEKGNPYYESTYLYRGEGQAVFVKSRGKNYKTRKQKNTKAQKTTARESGYSSGWVAIDGNNIFGEIYSKNQSFDETFKIMNKFLLRLQSSTYTPHLFWDGAFIRFAIATGNAAKGDDIRDVLTSNLLITKENITISNADKRADELIVSWAHLKKAAVISGDNFSKKIDDQLIIHKSEILRNSGLLMKYKIIAEDIVVPDLKNLN